MTSPFYFDILSIETDSVTEFCDCGVLITDCTEKADCVCEDLSDFVTDTEEQSSYSASESEFESDYTDSEEDE